MRTFHQHKGLITVVVLAVLVFWLTGLNASQDNSYHRGGALVVTSGEQKTDMARMVEAYERLSSQYLTMVQQNLSMMSNNDQQILNKLNDLEKKMDELTKKVEIIQEQTAPKTNPQPVPADKAPADDSPIRF